LGSRRVGAAIGGGLLATALALGGVLVGDRREGHAGGDIAIRLSQLPEQHDETQGVYRRGVMIVDNPAVQKIVVARPEGDIVLATRVSLERLRRMMPAEAERKDGSVVLRQVQATISVLSMSQGFDPLDVAIAVREQVQDVEASPVHVIGLAPHWRYSPGAPPAQLNSLKLSAVLPTPATGAPTVAVIDTGFIPGTLNRSAASSTLRGVRAVTIEDRELPGLDPSLAGHGTFVASLIRQMDPRLRVVVGRLGAIPSGASLDGHDGGDISAPMLSDEMHLLAAVIRMKQFLVGHGTPTVALNLSLGTPASTAATPRLPENVDVDGLAVGVRAAIDHWNAPSGWLRKRAPVVIAAAGNHEGAIAIDPPAPFLPGAYSDVYSVIALDGSGQKAPFTFLGWPTDPTILTAPGSRIVGVRRVAAKLVAENQLWSWGGTSFATALASAQAATTNPPQSVDMDHVGPPPGGPPPDVLVIIP